MREQLGELLESDRRVIKTLRGLLEVMLIELLDRMFVRLLTGLLGDLLGA